jgi:hypothetical protein
MKNLKKNAQPPAFRAALAVGAMALGISASAQAVIYDFDHQVWGSSAIPEVAAAGSQVFVEVTENLATADNDVLFKFTNGIPFDESRIVNIFIDTGNYTSLFSSMSIYEQSAGVNLTMPGDLDSLNVGNSFGISFTTDYSVGRFRGDPSINGINPGEYLTLSATLGSGMSFADVVTAMDVGIDDNQTTALTGLRIAEIVHRIWGETDDKDHGGYATANVVAVPEAETWAMLLAGLGLVGFMARRRRI